MSEQPPRRLPRITRNRLIALGIVIAGVVILAAVRPEVVMEALNLAQEG